MCGFTGVITDEKTHDRAFADSLQTIRSRGVMTDTYKANGCMLGYCRLPTDDVFNAGLGKINSGPKGILLFNGLITNTDYLAEHYNLPAAVKRSDSVCLQEGVAAYGSSFLRRCRGMFAAAFVTDGHILLARDTIGIKPLYFVYRPGLFAFASEIKALLPFGEPVNEVLPGQLITYRRANEEIKVKSFTYRPYQKLAAIDLEKCLTEAVVMPTERYLNDSPKKIALLLSGGLDSSIIAQLLVSHLSPDHQKRLVAFCIGSTEAGDVQAAKRLAKYLGLRLVHVPLPAPEIALRRLPSVVYHVESPLARVARVGLLYDLLAREIKSRDIDVVIGGEGADELFHGYHRFINDLSPEQSQKAFDLFYRGVFFNTLLQRYERIFARRQIEGRVPFLDQEVIELARQIAPDGKVRRYADGSHTSKLPLRTVAKQVGLPRSIYDRPKEKMTNGATRKENATGPGGYLETETEQIAGMSFQDLVSTLYRSFYYNHKGDILKRSKQHLTEEEIMEAAL